MPSARVAFFVGKHAMIELQKVDGGQGEYLLRQSARPADVARLSVIRLENAQPHCGAHGHTSPDEARRCCVGSRAVPFWFASSDLLGFDKHAKVWRRLMVCGRYAQLMPAHVESIPANAFYIIEWRNSAASVFLPYEFHRGTYSWVCPRCNRSCPIQVRHPETLGADVRCNACGSAFAPKPVYQSAIHAILLCTNLDPDAAEVLNVCIPQGDVWGLCIEIPFRQLIQTESDRLLKIHRARMFLRVPVTFTLEEFVAIASNKPDRLSDSDDAWRPVPDFTQGDLPRHRFARSLKSARFTLPQSLWIRGINVYSDNSLNQPVEVVEFAGTIFRLLALLTALGLAKASAGEAFEHEYEDSESFSHCAETDGRNTSHSVDLLFNSRNWLKNTISHESDIIELWRMLCPSDIQYPVQDSLDIGERATVQRLLRKRRSRSSSKTIG